MTSSLATHAEIKAEIASFFESSPILTGSEIGNRLRFRFPGINMRRDYGGVADFIKEHLASDIFFQGKSGQDDLFGNVRPTEAPPRKSATVQSTAPWRGFTNPQLSGFLYYSRLQSTLLYSELPPPADEGNVVIERLSSDEQREMMLEYARSHMAPQEFARFELVLTSNNSKHWEQFRQLLQEAGNKRFRQWTAYRKQRLQELLKDRLRAATLTEEQINHCIQQLYQASPLPAGLLTAEPLTASPSTSAVHGESALNLRSILLEAIAIMDESQLRSIELPAGVFSDSLQRLLGNQSVEVGRLGTK